MTTNGSNRVTEVKPEVVFLGRLLERVLEGRMLVPRFQRAFVWRQADMLTLLESVVMGFPIGSLLVWETDDPVSSLANVGPVPVTPRSDGIVAYILDGHQRIATLLGTLMFHDGLDNPQHNVDWKIYCDLDDMNFLREPYSGLQPQHFPVRNLLSTSGFLKACRGIQDTVDPSRADKLLRAADRVASAVRNFQLPLISVSEGDMDTAVAVFARLNLKGRKMSRDQMVSALTYREGGFDLAEKLDELQDQIAVRGYGELDRVFLLRVVLAAMNRDIYASDFADLLVRPELRAKLPASVATAEKGVHRAIDCLHGWGVTSDRLLPYGLQLVFLADFFRLCPDPSKEIADVLQRWFWVTSFTGWFGGVNSTQARLALAEMRNLAQGKVDAFNVLNLDEPARPFPIRHDARSSRVRTFLLYLASLRPLALKYEDELNCGELLSKQGPKALAFVVAADLPSQLQRSPANRMYVDLEHNGQAISALSILNDQRLDELLPSHGFPSDAKSAIQQDDREALIRSRLKHLVDGERQFMRERNVVLPVQRSADVLADSDVSDDE